LLLSRRTYSPQTIPPQIAFCIKAKLKQRRNPRYRRPASYISSTTIGNVFMRIRLGYEIIVSHPQPTPMLAHLTIHESRAPHLIILDQLVTDPVTPVTHYRDGFGNTVTRMIAPAGQIRLTTDALIWDPGIADSFVPDAAALEVPALPDEVLRYLLGSRYCETDKMMQIAWDNFGYITGGWNRVQAICNFAHNQITFGYHFARNTRTAFEAYEERVGVCRDFAHLAVTLCRCMNIPARYCTGYLGDIGVPKDPAPMDFSAWFEAYIGGRWLTFDARHNVPRIGRVLIARGMDAADTAITTHFGPNTLQLFRVWTDEVQE
jgi:transglutaminase-like putative cysteine protease